MPSMSPDQRQRVTSEMEAIIDAADGEGRDLTDAEISKIDTLRIRLQVDDAHRSAGGGTTPPVRTGQPTVEDTAFATYLRTGRVGDGLRNAQGTGTDAGGGYTVPAEFRRIVTEALKAYGGVAQLAETVDTGTGAPLSWPTLDDTANVGEIVSEHGTWTGGSDFTFGTVQLGAHRYASGGAGSTPIRVSVELLQDSGIDVPALIARKLAERLGRVQAQHLVTGTGTGQPRGIITGKVGTQVATSGALTFDDLVGFVHAVDPAYRAEGCAWVMNDASLQRIRALKDSNGDPLWRPSLEDPGVMSVAGSLLGFPVHIDQAFPNMNLADSDTNWGVFGNIRRGYIVRRVRDIVIAVNPYSRMNFGEVEFSGWARMDGAVQDPRAYIALAGRDA